MSRQGSPCGRCGARLEPVDQLPCRNRLRFKLLTRLHGVDMGIYTLCVQALVLRNMPMDQTMHAGIVRPAERSKRWRAGVATRLDEIRAELERLGAEITRELAALTDRLGEDERRQGRRQ